MPRKPITAPEIRQSSAYLAGVLHGDGYCSKLLGLNCKDRDFIEAFVSAVQVVTGRSLTIGLHSEKYLRARTNNGKRQFDPLRHYEPRDATEKGLWLRGLFDSEGNAQLTPAPKLGPNSYSRRIVIVSTSVPTLERASGYLADLGIPCVIRPVKSGDGHYGSRPVYWLTLVNKRDHFADFLRLVGTSITRKRERIEAIVASYRPDLSAHCREIGARGAATKRRRAIEKVLPRVLIAIRDMRLSGMKPTQRECGRIQGYYCVLRYHPHSELVEMAKELKDK